MLERLRNQFCERVEMTPLMMFTKNPHNGIKCNNVANDCRYLDLKSMVQHCLNVLTQNTKFWLLDPIVDYATLNVAACLAVYHTSLQTLSDSSLTTYVRAQHCETMIYINQLLRTHKDGKLYRKVKLKLAKIVQGSPFNRDLMLPLIPNDILKHVACFYDLPHKITAVAPLPAGKVQQKSNSEDIIGKRVLFNLKEAKAFETNVLRCNCCKRLFFGGKGRNDVALYQDHLAKNPHHNISGTLLGCISKSDWNLEFRNREQEMLDKCNDYYSQEQTRAYQAVLKGQKSLLLMGVGGSGKSTLLKDIKYVLECVFWQQGEIALCGATNAVARERLGMTATSFHSLLGVTPMDNVPCEDKWNLTLSHCMTCIRRNSQKLSTVRVVILEEGLELQSVLMEAYFRHINETGWKCITLINGDVCQGSFREDSSGRAEI
jgi:hypothetical protein